MNALQGTGELKYKNSKLFKFLKGINKGALDIKDNELVEDPARQAEIEREDQEMQ